MQEVRAEDPLSPLPPPQQQLPQQAVTKIPGLKAVYTGHICRELLLSSPETELGSAIPASSLDNLLSWLLEAVSERELLGVSSSLGDRYPCLICCWSASHWVVHVQATSCHGGQERQLAHPAGEPVGQVLAPRLPWASHSPTLGPWPRP